MPEELLGKWKRSIMPQWKICFVSALIVGLITHLYKITNWLPNWDSLVFRYDAQNMVSLGRWFLAVASAPSSFYDLPWITGLMAIVFHALGAVFICRIFEIQKNITAVLLGAAVVSFPTVTSVMLYNYVADSYALSFFMACVAAFLMTKKKPHYMGAVILLALSMGIYQAYLAVTVMLVLCFFITEIINKDTDVKTFWGKCVKVMLTGLSGAALYYIVLVVILKFSNASLLEYQGLNSAASFGGIDIGATLYTMKESFFNYFFDFSNGFQVFVGINLIIFVLTVLFYLVDIIRNRLCVSKILIVCVLGILLPVGANIFCLVNSSIDYHNLMKMGFFVFYLFLILQYEKTDMKSLKSNKVKAWTVLGITAVLIFQQIMIANISYHKITMAYEKSYGTLIRIADRLEQTEGAQDCEKILILGSLEDSEAYSVNLPPDMTGTTDGLILRADDEIMGQSVLCSALNDYCGKNYEFIAGEEKRALIQNDEVKRLKNWPEKDSVSVIENVIVIKFNEEF